MVKDHQTGLVYFGTPSFPYLFDKAILLNKNIFVLVLSESMLALECIGLVTVLKPKRMSSTLAAS